jgi:hypothetical protein
MFVCDAAYQPPQANFFAPHHFFRERDFVASVVIPPGSTAVPTGICLLKCSSDTQTASQWCAGQTAFFSRSFASLQLKN